MADLTTTQLKLRTTPTAGVASEQSPYYRRLLSAGYKGFLQGTVGGSTLYGAIGAGIGAAVALPLIAFTPVGLAALALIPAMGGLGLYKGAATFGNIGSFAAITAESAEMSEKRRYLLDRYYDLPDTPEFDDEAAQIRNLLAKQHESRAPHQMFHWRTVAVGAAIGAAVSMLFLAAAPALAAIGGHFALLEVAHTAVGAALTTVVGTALGALSGGMIGLDRYYVRGWLDKSSDMLNDTRHIEEQMREREMEIEQLGASSPDIRNASVTQVKQYLPPAHHDAEAMKINIGEPKQPLRAVDESHPHGTTRRELPVDPRTIAGIADKPTTMASNIQHDRVVALEQALRNPVL